MNMPFLPVIRESLGFAAHKYDTIARLAWFPVLLILLFGMMFPYLQMSILSDQLVTIQEMPLGKAKAIIAKNEAYLWQNDPGKMIGLAALAYIFITIASASFLVPLMQLAARGENVTHRSLSLAFGPRHWKFVWFSLLTIFGIGMITVLPLTATSYYVTQYVADAMATQYAVFPDSDSLHTITVESALADRAPFDRFLVALGSLFGLAMVYFSIRMFAAPVFGAVREKSDGYNSFGASWRLTKGWNAFWVALIALLLVGSTVIVSMVINAYALPLMLNTLMAIWVVLRGVAGLEPGSGISSAEILDILAWIWVVVRTIAHMLWMFFVIGIIAGLGGALFRQIPDKA